MFRIRTVPLHSPAVESPPPRCADSKLIPLSAPVLFHMASRALNAAPAVAHTHRCDRSCVHHAVSVQRPSPRPAPTALPFSCALFLSRTAAAPQPMSRAPMAALAAPPLRLQLPLQSVQLAHARDAVSPLLCARLNGHRAAQCARTNDGSFRCTLVTHTRPIFVMRFTALNLHCAALRCLSVSAVPPSNRHATPRFQTGRGIVPSPVEVKPTGASFQSLLRDSLRMLATQLQTETPSGAWHQREY